jgi:predicted  nucleic acid-binding Zn-ribbon protein
MNIKNAFLTVLLAGFILILGSCAPKITNPQIEKLESKEAILALNTRLNQLNLALEKEKVSVVDLELKVKKANKESSKSASKSSDLSSKLSKNPGDAKLASRASKAAKIARRDAKRAEKANDRLSESRKNIEKYLKDIEKTKEKLTELEAKIEFVPNQ